MVSCVRKNAVPSAIGKFTIDRGIFLATVSLPGKADAGSARLLRSPEDEGKAYRKVEKARDEEKDGNGDETSGERGRVSRVSPRVQKKEV